jgi:hypothetical protein
MARQTTRKLRQILHNELMFVVTNLLRATSAAQSALQLSEFGHFDSTSAGGDAMRHSADVIAAATKSLRKAQAAWREAVHAANPKVDLERVFGPAIATCGECLDAAAKSDRPSKKKRRPRRAGGGK